MFRNRARGAFTLVELLVVVGIITVLISILFPALGRARLAAKEVQCESGLKQFGIAIQSYVGQNQGALPQKGPDGSNNGKQSFTSGNGVIGYDDPSLWFNALPPFINSKSYYDMLYEDSLGGEPAPHPTGGPNNIFVCPLAGPPGTQGGIDLIDGDYYLLYGKDSSGAIRSASGLAAIGEFKFNMSYVWNSKLTTYNNQGTQVTSPVGINITQCLPSSDVVLMVEKIANAGEYLDIDVQRWNLAHPSVYYPKTLNLQGCDTNVAQSKSDWTRFAARHDHGGNLLYADGHVEHHAWTDVQYPNSQITPTYNAVTSNANQPGIAVWSALGPVNSGPP